MAELATRPDLYKAHRTRVDFVDVPEFGFAIVTGRGDPNGGEFAAAVRALFTVSYSAHFLVKKERGEAPRVMPLEALWWIAGDTGRDVMLGVARGEIRGADVARDQWRWQAMMMQPAPIDAAVVEAAVSRAGAKGGPALGKLRFECWTEGPCAQLLHVGPYGAEGPSVLALHDAITAAGYRARGQHHEIYLGDPRRSAPERLRTILRHPIEAVPGG
jgi:hypothetical protein